MKNRYEMHTEQFDIPLTNLNIINAEIEDDKVLILWLDIGFLEISHIQECCEQVQLVDIPYLETFTGTTLLKIEEKSNNWPSELGIAGWTFYKLYTTKGTETLRFTGESNGYYSIEATIRLFVSNKLLFDNEIDTWN